MKYVLLIAVIHFFFINRTYSQDTIYTSHAKILCRVNEVGIKEIKYKDWDNLEGSEIVIRKIDIQKIIFQNGSVVYTGRDEYDSNNKMKIINKKNVLKIAPFSPLFEKLEFSYERLITSDISLEAKLGYIGLGSEYGGVETTADGGYLSLSFKSYIENRNCTGDMKDRQPMDGIYIKLQYTYTNFIQKDVKIRDYNSSGYVYPYASYVNSDCSNISNMFFMVFGIQYVLRERVAMDYYAGLGGGFTRYNAKNSQVVLDDNNYSPNIFYSHLRLYMDCFVTAGISIGYLF